MNFRRAGEILRNLSHIPFAKQYSITPENAKAALEQVWPDAGTSCYLPRDAAWHTPDDSVDVSVIVPTYNDSLHIVQAVESVLTQKTEYSIELIVINDGSTDNTRELLAPYEDHPNVRIVHQANAGHSGARNTGLRLCRGKYLMFLDSDDTLLPGAIQSLTHCAAEHHADVAAGSYRCLEPDGSEYPGQRYPDGPAEPGDLYGMPWGKVYRRELFNDLAFPNKYWYQDSMFAQIVLPERICRTVKEDVYLYFQNEAGISAVSHGKKKSIDSLYITEALLRDKPRFGKPLDEAAYRHFLGMILLTHRRTEYLSPEIQYAIFQQQRHLKDTFYPHISLGTPMEKALQNNHYKQYLWLCETQWLTDRIREKLHHG